MIARTSRVIIRAIVALALLLTSTVAQTSPRVTGFVYDQNGGAIPNASVRFATAAGTRTRVALTDDEGHFEFENIEDRRGTLTVEAAGFRESTIELTDSAVELQIVLLPAAVSGTVTVTGSETKIEDTAASVIAIGRRDLETSGASTLDDRLRHVPGFTLFRRAGSRTANPTTQGVSLRGVGASGASRALVIEDGIPLNDPFGGWVYWGRVPSASISQVEILRGTSGDLYGSSAIGGVVAISTRRPGDDPFANLEASYGTQNTPNVSASASLPFRGWRGSLGAELFKTDGFIPVEKSERGSVDSEANVDRSVLTPAVEHGFFHDRSRIFASAEFFQEQRENGTRLQANDTHLRRLSVGADLGLAIGSLMLRGNVGSQNYHQTFSAVAADRNSETLNRIQHVPADFYGFSGQWSGNYRRSVFFAGAESRAVRGHSDETGIGGAIATSRTDSGGREFTSGLFAGALIPVTSRLTVGGGFRFDWWRNVDGFTKSLSLITGVATSTTFPDRSESAFSPRLSALYRISKHTSIAATYSRGFRRPTLNELYRNFRVGDVLTLANSNLRAERATSVDAAVIVNALDSRFYARGGFFCTSISENVSNVTLTITPTLITRQRQNVGRTRSCGIESDMSYFLRNDLKISGSYLFADSRIARFPANMALEGLRVPQVARHQASVQISYLGFRHTTLGLQLRAVGSQFDDDLNLFRLVGFLTTDAFVARRLTKNFEIFGAVENIFNTPIEAGRTPVLTLASERSVRAGIRVTLGRGK